jgi:hypothetical protein
MKVIKRKILKEHLISRNPDSTYGTVTASTISFKILFTQKIKDIGLYSDVDFVNENLLEEYSNGTTPNTNNILVNKLVTSGLTFPFMTGATSTMNQSGFTGNLRISGSDLSSYTSETRTVTGITENKILDLRTYSNINPFIVGFNVGQEQYIDYTGGTINGVSQIFDLSLNNSGYTFDANNDINLGTSNQNTGIIYNNTQINGIDRTTVKWKGQGFNESNVVLSGIVKEEYLFGITSKPEVQSDIFIDRTTSSILDLHLRLSEIKSIEHLTLYNGGFYNIIKE